MQNPVSGLGEVCYCSVSKFMVNVSNVCAKLFVRIYVAVFDLMHDVVTATAHNHML